MAPTTRSQTAAHGRSQDELSRTSSSSRLNHAPSISNSVRSDDAPPLYIIDLSLPPSKRYVKVARDFKPIIGDLTSIFDELLEEANLPKKTFHFIARCILTRLHSKEQTDELRAIGKVIGVPMYLLVAYNVLLDLFMGCTSGGALVNEPRNSTGKVLHFRTLDWGMPALRKALVRYEFRSGPEGNVIARTISYVGFVGTLTGVREGLSVSLNLRPYHNNDESLRSNVRFYLHVAAVLVGWRPGICAHLRDMIIPTQKELERVAKEAIKEDIRNDQANVKYRYSHATLDDIAQKFPQTPTTAVYLTFCDSTQILVLEKDRVTAKPLLNSSFLAVTNHDTSYEPPGSSLGSATPASEAHAAHAKSRRLGTLMSELIDESMERKGCLTASWESHVESLKERGHMKQKGVRLDMLKEWLLEYPVTNEQTHFVAIMDPEKGDVIWCRSWEEGEVERVFLLQVDSCDG